MEAQQSQWCGIWKWGFVPSWSCRILVLRSAECGVFFSPPSALKKIRAKPLRLVRGLWFFWISAHRINIQMNCSNYIYSNIFFFVFDFLTMIVNCCLLFDDLLTDFSLRKGEGCFWPLSRTWQEPKFTSEETKELMTKPAPWQSQ